MLERRKYKREDAFLLGWVDQQIVYITDISEKGMHLVCSEKLGEPEDVVDIHIRVPSSLLDDFSIRGKIRWKKEGKKLSNFGVEILNYDGVEETIQKVKDLNTFISRVRGKFLT